MPMNAIASRHGHDRYEPAPDDPGIIPGGIRDRAVTAVRSRGPRPAEEAKSEALRQIRQRAIDQRANR
jgi:hypothetical protein